jgi:hypothetical protein
VRNAQGAFPLSLLRGRLAASQSRTRAAPQVVLRVLVEHLGRVLGDAGRLVYLGGVAALLAKERRWGELRRAEGRPVSGRAQVSAAGAFADGQDVVAEHP